jgi:hypothetical protein
MRSPNDWHPEDREDKMVKGMPDCREWGLIAFEDYQLAHSPRGRLAVAPGKARRKAEGPYYYQFKSGGFDFFVCDTRSERQGRSKIIQDEQMAALKKWLRDSKQADGRPCFVVSPSVLLPESRLDQADDWGGFSESLADLLGYIVKENLRVVFLCGDSHLAMTTRITFPGRAKDSCQSLCIASTPLYAPMPFANARPADAHDAGEIVLADKSKVAYRRRTGSIASGDGITIVGARQESEGWWVTVDIYRKPGGKPKTKRYKLD